MLPFEKILQGKKQTAIENNKCFLGPQVCSCDQKQVCKSLIRQRKKITCKS